MARTKTVQVAPTMYGVGPVVLTDSRRMIAWFSTRENAERAQVDGTAVYPGHMLYGDAYVIPGGGLATERGWV